MTVYISHVGSFWTRIFCSESQAFKKQQLQHYFRKAQSSVRLGYLWACSEHATSLLTKLWFLSTVYRIHSKFFDLAFLLTITFSRLLFPLQQVLSVWLDTSLLLVQYIYTICFLPWNSHSPSFLFMLSYLLFKFYFSINTFLIIQVDCGFSTFWIFSVVSCLFFFF